MPRAKSNKTKATAKVEVEEVVSNGPAGVNETTGEPITREGFIAYMENMKENEPKKFAKKEAELNKKLEAISE